ncbi:glycosyltransferase family 2 protein [Paenibacillus sp. GYB004]|uniref:glycosyltransferase family 2 protein n=1 Tax=Paenibacillus sp. GYB004 TaxID=2994393 RepID=UPI002F9684D6
MARNDTESSPKPLVSVVTPSYQQGPFIRETIESIVSQDYPNVELIVVDGGSKDETVAILEKYARRYGDRFRYISEKDRGQSHALNKGLALARGEIIGWLNSDDTYWPKAIRRAVDSLRKHPEYGLVYGKANHTDRNNQLLRPYPVDPSVDRVRLFDVCTVCQPAVFIRKKVLDDVGPIDESLQFCMDYDLWMRISAKYRFGYIDEVLANSRLHDDCKSMKQYFSVGLPEIIRSSLKNYGTVSNNWIIQFIAHHLPEGPGWLMEKLHPFRLFGGGYRIVSSNRFEDGWAPPSYTLEIDSGGSTDAKWLLIEGDHLLPKVAKKTGDLVLTVQVNGRRLLETKTGEGAFTLKIPLEGRADSYSVDIRANTSFVPAQLDMNDDRRRLSFKVNGAVPLSQAGMEMYDVLKEDPASVGHWLVRHRKSEKISRRK